MTKAIQVLAYANSFSLFSLRITGSTQVWTSSSRQLVSLISVMSL